MSLVLVAHLENRCDQTKAVETKGGAVSRIPTDLPRRMLIASLELVTHCLREFMILVLGSWSDGGGKQLQEGKAKAPVSFALCGGDVA